MTDMIVPVHYRNIAEYAYLVLALVFFSWGLIRIIGAAQGKTFNTITVPPGVAGIFDMLMASGLITSWYLLRLLEVPGTVELVASFRLWTLTFRFLASIIGVVMLVLFYVRTGDRLFKDFKQWRRERDAGEMRE